MQMNIKILSQDSNGVIYLYVPQLQMSIIIFLSDVTSGIGFSAITGKKSRCSFEILHASWFT